MTTSFDTRNKYRVMRTEERTEGKFKSAALQSKDCT